MRSAGRDASSGIVILASGAQRFCDIYDLFVDNNGTMYILRYNIGQIMLWIPSMSTANIAAGDYTAGLSTSQLY